MAHPPDDYDSQQDLDWLRAELRARDRTVAELRQELDEAEGSDPPVRGI